MSFRTDLEYRNGKLSARNDTPGADARQPLPEVKPTDRLVSTKWAEHLQREAGGVSDHALSAVTNTHSSLVTAFNDLVMMRDNQSPETTQAAHLKRVASATDQALTRLGTSVTAARKAAQERLLSLEAEAKREMRFTDRGNAAELRSIIRGMDHEARSEVIARAVESKDGELLSAIFDCHPLQVGMNSDQHRSRFEHAMQKHSPGLLKLRKALTKGDDLLKQSFADFLERSDAITARQVRESYEAQAKAAAEAQSRLGPAAAGHF